MKKLTSFLRSDANYEFGDYLLFQEYIGDGDIMNVSKPRLVIYLGAFVADQTLGFNYVRWNNDNHRVLITNEYVTNYPVCKEVSGIESHIEWSDYIDILGHWKHKPSWKEIIEAYRKQNTKTEISSDEIDWTY